MAQMSLFETGWKNTIYEVIDTISVYEGLPAGSLMLVENLSRVKKTVSSYSVSILKPDYPKGMNPNGRAKNVLINIKDVTKKSDSNDVLSISVPDNVLVRIRNEFPSVNFVKKEKDPITRALIPVDSKDIKIFRTLYSHPSSFNFNYRSVLQRYSHLPTCTSISKRHKSFRQLYIVGMVVPIAPDTSV